MTAITIHGMLFPLKFSVGELSSKKITFITTTIKVYILVYMWIYM